MSLLMEIIRSRQNPTVKHLLKLAGHRRERLKQRQTLLLGIHLIESAIAASWPLDGAFICEGEESAPEVAALFGRLTCPVRLLARELFDEIEQHASTTRIMALGALPAAATVRSDGFCLLLECIQDPGNVGSILRSAAASNVDQVWLTPGCADAWSPKVLRAGMGAHFQLSIVERLPLESVLPSFDGKVLVTTLSDATSLYKLDLRGDIVLALCSEGGGASADLLKYATDRVHIPMSARVESLNVAAAAAVCMFERLRQLQAP